VIDKLDVRIPAGATFAQSFPLRSELQRGELVPGFFPSRFYALNGDLREFGIDAAIHLGYRRGQPQHKLELIDTGEKSYAEVLAAITAVFNVDPFSLALMRLDLAADIPDVPVGWFRDHARFRFKQFSSRIEKASQAEEVQFVEMGTAAAQSLYVGKRPNLVRIYDKRHELWLRWRQLIRETERFEAALMELGCSGVIVWKPTFVEFCRVHRIGNAKVLTRIERQIGGSRFPDGLATVGDLRNLADFDPFENLEIVSARHYRNAAALIASPEAAPTPIRDRLAGIGLQCVCSEIGTQKGFALVTRHGNGNGRRVLHSLRPFWPGTRDSIGCTREQIIEAFRASVSAQLSGEIPLTDTKAL